MAGVYTVHPPDQLHVDFHEPHVLCDDYPTDELHHRHSQLDHLTTGLVPTHRTDVGADVRSTGLSGTGKTPQAKFVLSELEREVLDLRWGYVSCLSDTTANSVLAQLVRRLNLVAVRSEGPPVSVLDRFRDYEGPIVAVLDEVDKFTDDAVPDWMDDVPARYDIREVDS